MLLMVLLFVCGCAHTVEVAKIDFAAPLHAYSAVAAVASFDDEHKADCAAVKVSGIVAGAAASAISSGFEAWPPVTLPEDLCYGTLALDEKAKVAVAASLQTVAVFVPSGCDKGRYDWRSTVKKYVDGITATIAAGGHELPGVEAVPCT